MKLEFAGRMWIVWIRIGTGITVSVHFLVDALISSKTWFEELMDGILKIRLFY